MTKTREASMIAWIVLLIMAFTVSVAGASYEGTDMAPKLKQSNGSENVIDTSKPVDKSQTLETKIEVSPDQQFAILHLADCRIVVDSLLQNDRAPERKLAEARIEFTAGTLAGETLDGFGIWFGETKGTGLQVYASVPERSYGTGFRVRRYQLLQDTADKTEPSDKPVTVGVRGQRQSSNTDRVKGMILEPAIAMFGGIDKLRDVVKQAKARKATESTAAATDGKTPAATPGRISL